MKGQPVESKSRVYALLQVSVIRLYNDVRNQVPCLERETLSSKSVTAFLPSYRIHYSSSFFGCENEGAHDGKVAHLVTGTPGRFRIKRTRGWEDGGS